MLSSLFKVSPIATCPDEACLVVDFSGTNYDCNIPNVSVCFKLFSKAPVLPIFSLGLILSLLVWLGKEM